MSNPNRISKRQETSRVFKVLCEAVGVAFGVGINVDLDILEKFAKLPVTIASRPYSSKFWRYLRVVAILAPRYELALPEVKATTKARFLSHLRSPKSKSPIELIRAIEALPTIALDAPIRNPRKVPKIETHSRIEKHSRIDDVRIKQFYLSYEWRRLRYFVLKNYGRVCMLCGTTEGAMHGDHIKPLRKYWELRLDPENIQILCEVCNHGKGNWDETDWRPK